MENSICDKSKQEDNTDSYKRKLQLGMSRLKILIIKNGDWKLNTIIIIICPNYAYKIVLKLNS